MEKTHSKKHNIKAERPSISLLCDQFKTFIHHLYCLVYLVILWENHKILWENPHLPNKKLPTSL